MRRGDVITVADRGGEFSGKPRPAVIIQSDAFAAMASVTVCPITSIEVDAPLFRIELLPAATLPLDRKSWIEIDKVTTVRRTRLGQSIGWLSDADLVRLNSAVAVFLGLG